MKGFKTANPENEWDITFRVVGESDARGRVLEGLTADVFAFANLTACKRFRNAFPLCIFAVVTAVKID